MSFKEVKGIKLHYQMVGQMIEEATTTVVFLHGLVMDNLSSWFFTVANQAAQKNKILLYDLRGHGFSDRPKTHYTVEDHVSDLEELLKSLDITKPVILVGNSYGGLLAINYAKKFPDKVLGMILIDAQVNDDEWKGMMTRSLGLQGTEMNQAIEQNFQNWLGRNSSRKSNRLAKNAHELVHETSLISDIQKSHVMSESDIRSIEVPTLAAYGSNSDIFHIAKKLEKTMPSLELKIFEGCTHSVLWEKTDDVKELILDQISKFKENENG